MHTARSCLTAALLATSALAAPAFAQDVAANALPNGGNVVAGGAAIGQPSPNAMTITQSSDKAIIDWQGFSVGRDASIVISQPDAQSALLNRVTGDTRSTIAGSISANGQLFLINPNGIVISKTGKVSAAGFAASSLDIANEDFLSGHYNFTGTGASAMVANHGTITMVGRGGYAALIGGQVANSGLIAAPLGRIGLGAGERATLDFAGDGFLQVAVPSAALGDGALVEMSGKLSAEGGLVVVTAAQAREAARQAVNLTGVVEARSITGHDGAIVLSGGEGAVAISGTLDASGTHGGNVTVTGDAITLTGATMDVSGETGGGTARIGGDWQGQGPLARARNTSVDAASTIRADATASGDGGTVVVWSDDETRFAGTISATAPGTGGDAEVSGKAWLAYTGTADLRGTAGFGDLLLDPYDVTISNGANTGHVGFTANANGSVINAATLIAALGTANVTVSTGSGGNPIQGMLQVAAPLTWDTTATLTLSAANGIFINRPISARAGGLTLNAGGETTNVNSPIEVARFTLQSGNWVQLTPTLPAFAAGDFRLEGGTFLRAVGGSGTAGNPYQLTDIYGVQGMATLLGSSFALTNDIDASGTANWNGGAGFSPIGTDASRFTGRLDGRDHVISDLTINRPSQNEVGLFGAASGATIANVGITDANITGRGLTGALTGHALAGSTITRSWASGAVSGAGAVGGLVGDLSGSVSDSWASASVSGVDFVGGLVGSEFGGSITRSWASGAVSGTSFYAGGLAGRSHGGISYSWASGAVSGNETVGGLVGLLTGGISQSWASGAVSGNREVGGLAGYNMGGINTSFWDTQTTGQGFATGGSSGSVSATALSTAQARNFGSYAGFDPGVWYQAGDMRPILRSMAAPAVGGEIAVSNIYQLQLMGADPAGDYILANDIDASLTGASNAAGVWGASGFVPVGAYSHAGLTFTGTFDGAGHVISGLTSNQSELASLFGYAEGATITNVGLANVNISGDLTIGGLAGYQDGGTIARSWVSGTVIAQGGSVGGIVGHQVSGTIIESGSSADVQGFTNVMIGGLVGYSQSSTISKSWASGSVTGTFDHVGGLVGHAVFGTSISQSWASGTVSGDWFVGGLAGSSDGSSISQSWASGSVSGNRNVGGLVGSQNSGSISQSWASGAVSSNGSVGGLLGDALGGTVTASYWDTQTTGQAASGGGAGAVGLTTAQAREQASYAGWNFTTDWYQAGDMRPILRSTAAAADADGNIAVSNIYQLQLMAANLAGDYVLTGDIDASLTNSTAASSGIWGAGGFVPVGNGIAFTGSLDGAEHIISGLAIDRAQHYVGLFGVTRDATIANIGLAGASIAGDIIVGPLVGIAFASTISRSWATGSVSGGVQVGGLVGVVTSPGSITQSWASTTVSGVNQVGGLVGLSEAPITQSWASGAVSGNQDVGGLVGRSYRDIGQSWASGAVSGNDRVGGLVAWQASDTISQSWSSGAVTGTSQVGGLVGLYEGTITASFWDVDTTGQASLAGPMGGGIVDVFSAGLTHAQFQDTAGFMALAGAAGWDFQNDWAPSSSGFYPTLYATHRVVAVDAAAAVSATTQVYGNAPAALGLARYYGLQAGDFLRTAATFTGAPTAATGVGTYAIGATGAAAYDPAYRVVVIPGSVTVTPRPITVAADALSRIYGDANPMLTYSFVGPGLVNGDALDGDLATTAALTSNVGTYAIAQGTLGNSNYQITYQGANLSVTARPITVTADALSRIYGDANPMLTYAVGGMGLVNGDMLGGQLATTAGLASNVGAYGITLGTLGNSNYQITAYSGANLSVTARPITVTADALSRIYGDANPALTYAVGGMGLVNGDELAGGLVTTADGGSNVGTYAIGQGTLGNSNYAITYAGADLTVTRRALVITPDAVSRIYGDANPTSGTATGDNLVNGDTITGVALSGTAAITDGVGSYGLTASAAPGLDNYAITYATFANGLTVTARPITVTADALSRIYGDANPMLTYAVGGMGLVNGDMLGGQLATTAGLASNVGAYGITLGTLGDANYTITYAGAHLTVTPRPITVAADALSRIYGDANPAFTYAIGGMGLVNGDALTGALSTAATASSNVGAYGINQGTLAASGNYDLAYTGANLTVTLRPITVTADALSRVYGDANPTLSYAVGGAGLVNGDLLSGMLTTAADGMSSVGAYAINQGTLAASTNYALVYTGANLAVTPRPLTITPDAASRIYGEANPVNGTATGDNLVNGDSIAGVALASPATAASGVGGYDLTATAATGTGLANYMISYGPLAGGLTITARPIIVAADALSRVYGDANPALTYSIGGLGLVNADRLSGMLVTDAGLPSGIGAYAIAQGTLTAGGNYALTYSGSTLTVTPRPITIAADPATRLYGHPNPAFTAILAGRGLAPFHADLAAAGLGLAAGADQLSPVGGYSIALAGANPNYAVTFLPAALTVAPVALPRDYRAGTIFLTDTESLLLPPGLLNSVLPMPPIDEEFFTRDPRLTGSVTCQTNDTCTLLH